MKGRQIEGDLVEIQMPQNGGPLCFCSVMSDHCNKNSVTDLYVNELMVTQRK